MSNHNPHVRQSLIPERLGGGAGEMTFQITAESVSPTVMLTDADGAPMEDTIPNAYWEWWVGLSGCFKRVVMRSCPVFSNDYQHKQYEHEKYVDHIKAGQMPAWVCPHTLEFKHIKGGPLVRPPAGVEACNGTGEVNKNCLDLPRVCKHMQAEMDKRRAASKKKHADLKKSRDQLTPEMAEKLMGVAGKAFAQETEKARARGKGKVEE